MSSTRTALLPYIATVIDTALSADHTINDVDARATLVGWQCGFEPMVIAVISATMDTKGVRDVVDREESEEIAIDYLVERKWFAAGPVEPDYVEEGV